MTKDEVFAVVKKHILDIVDGADADAITPEISMKDAGASSLDMVEVVSCTMRELKVRVPRSELSKLENIAGLVDLIHVAVLEKNA
ncbi:MAG: phosphopantetheine-binding protein [bacterium]